MVPSHVFYSQVCFFHAFLGFSSENLGFYRFNYVA